MKENKVVITSVESDVNKWLEQGWLVKTVISNHADNGSWTKWCFVLEKDK